MPTFRRIFLFRGHFPFLDIFIPSFMGRSPRPTFSCGLPSPGAKPSGSALPLFPAHFPLPSFFPAEHFMEILPSVLTWLSGVVNVAKKEISDATTDTANFLDKKSYQVTEAVKNFVSDSTGLPPDVFSRDLFANPIRAEERSSPACSSCGRSPSQGSQKRRHLFRHWDLGKSSRFHLETGTR